MPTSKVFRMDERYMFWVSWCCLMLKRSRACYSSCINFEFMSSINPYSLTFYQEQEQKHAMLFKEQFYEQDHINAQSTMYHRSVSCPGAGIQLGTIFNCIRSLCTP